MNHKTNNFQPKKSHILTNKKNDDDVDDYDVNGGKYLLNTNEV